MKRRRSKAMVNLPAEVKAVLETPADVYFEAHLPPTSTKQTKQDDRSPPAKGSASGAKSVIWPLPDTRMINYELFTQQHDTHVALTFAGGVILCTFIAILVNWMLVVLNQRHFTKSVLVDMMRGPIIATCLGGIIGLGMIMKNYGVAEKMFASVLIVPGFIIIFIGLWALVADASGAEKFDAFEVLNPFELRGEQIVWILLGFLVVLSTLEVWMEGNMRIDAIDPSKLNFFLFVCMAALLSFGLSHVFALVLRTMDYRDVDVASPESFWAYAGATAFVMFFLKAALIALESSLTMFSGNWFTIFAPPAGIGAAVATAETQRALRVCLDTIVIVTAALMWRRREAMEFKEETSKKLEQEWTFMFVVLLMAPIVALVSESVRKAATISPLVFEICKIFVVSVAVIMVGTGGVPWNELTTLAFYGVIVLITMQYASSNSYRYQFFTALLFAAMFNFAKQSFWNDLRADKISRCEEQDLCENIDDVHVSSWYTIWAWLKEMMLVLLISIVFVLFFAYARDENGVVYVALMFIVFLLVYTAQFIVAQDIVVNLLVLFTGTIALLSAQQKFYEMMWLYGGIAVFLAVTPVDVYMNRDDPLDLTVPGNEMASQVIDTIILAMVLWGFSSVYHVFRINELEARWKEWSKNSPVPLVPPTSEKIRGAGIGIVITIVFSVLRKDPKIRAFFKRAQTTAESNFDKLEKDVEIPFH